MLLALPGDIGARRARTTSVAYRYRLLETPRGTSLGNYMWSSFRDVIPPTRRFLGPSIATTVKGGGDIVNCLRRRALISVGHRTNVIAVLYAVEFGVT